jgi:hypothetical protein
MSNSNTKKSNNKKIGGFRVMWRWIAREFTLKSLYKDIFQGIRYDVDLIKGEIVNTKETLAKERVFIKKKSVYKDFEQMLQYHNMTLPRLVSVYRRYFISCFVLLSIIIYLAFVFFDSTLISVKLVCAMLSFTFFLYYIKYRMWMFMVESRKFVKIGKWMRAMWSYPIRFFPRRPGRVFSKLLEKGDR